MTPEEPEAPAREPRPLAWRLVRATSWVCLSIALLYVVGVNVFLSTPLFARVVNAKPDVVEVRFERAWSLVPWRVHAKNISVRGRDGGVEWILRLDDVELRPSFPALARMRFETKRVRGRGLSFRLRQRLKAAPASQAEVADLPPIEGLPPYSIRPPSQPSPAEWSDAEYNLWTARLEDVVAEDVREVWIDHTRFEGSARVEGRFLLEPMRAVEVGPARVAVARGGVLTGEGPVVEVLDGSRLGATLARFDPRTVGGADLLGRLSLDCDLHGVVPEVTRLHLLPAGVEAEGAAEIRQAVLHVQEGVLEPGSHLHATAAPIAVATAHYRASGRVELDADVARRAGDPFDRLTFRAAAADLEGFHGERGPPSTTAFVRAPGVEVAGDARALGLARPLEDLHVVVAVSRGHVPDVRALSRYIPLTTPLALEGGRATATGELEVWFGETRASGSVTLGADDLDLRLAKMRVRGRSSVVARFSSFHFGTRNLDDATVALEVSRGSFASNAAPEVPLVHVSGLRLDAHGHRVDLRDPLGALDVTIAMPAADIVAPGLLREYLPKGAGRRLVSGHGRVSLQGRLVLAGRVARGTLDIEAKALAFADRELRIDAGVRVRAAVHDWHWERGDLALDGASVQVDHPTISEMGKRGPGGESRTGASFARIAVSATSPRFVIDDPLSRVSISVVLAKARVHDPSALSAFLAEKTALAIESREGGFDADLHVDVESHVARGQLRVRAFDMGAGGKTVHLGGDVDLFADVAAWDLDRGTMSILDSRVTLTRVQGRFRQRASPDFSASRVALELRSSGFDLERPALRGGDLRLLVEQAVLPDARALGALLPPGSALAVESGTARVSADLAISDARRSASGAVDISLANGAVRLDDTRVSGDCRVHAGLRGYSPENHLVGLSDARVEMRNVAVTGASATTSAWRGDVTLSRASLRLAPSPELEGVVTLDARDARPLLALLFGNGLPNIAVRLADVPRLVGSAHFMVGADKVAVFDLAAGGGNVALRGSYAAIGDRHRGGVIARKWFLSMGLRLDGDGVHPRFFGLEGWMRNQRAAAMKLLEVESPR